MPSKKTKTGLSLVQTYNTNRYNCRLGGLKTHMVFCFVYPNEEEQLGDEEVDAKVLVDCVAVSLQTPQEAESGDADGQTH